ncbi:site-specific DNA-methyltransferase [Moraxella bovis]|uniref:site-specific DNA-methyltransferase n=1 Tax=Moraxella bovis TaxID=476 RepID=UPI002227C4ED|nr:site-specific DNA-methyltransferase [Moraxella bovis]UYZ68668.1 site-specific DNA-methyltransferase [Moraxella bovis]UZA27301.1 site-specific DNA-methyltransferase [Moraxella bovis]UZA38167.1 site-specific DNA-methyltransferase [Moraxella bovis]WAJ73490.1 site-specific DNA-methyltransferase [Moraxella bovis]
MTLKLHSPDLTCQNIAKIAELFPNVLTEHTDEHGNIAPAIDFELLRQELSSFIVEGSQERYRLDWVGKREAILTANRPIYKTLRPYKDESVQFDTTQNLFIEGDNLDALKLLQDTYLGAVKMIYIDPPYNTGNDFIYNDDFATDSEDYLAKSEQYDDIGNRLTINTESNGRFHSDWLSMMYARLKLARNLLADDGVIFISIDDNEQANLKRLCDEVFGVDNFVGQFPWRKRTAKSDVPFGVSSDYEYIIICAKSDKFVASVEGKERKYYETDDFPNRPWRIHDCTTQRTASERPNSFFTMIDPKSGKEYPANPNATWRVTKDTFQEYYDKGKIVFPDDYDFLKISRPVMRYFKDDDMTKAGDNFGRIAVSTKLPDNIGMSLNGTKEITELFNGKLFDFPKPINLISYFTQIIFDKNALILDFFAGSATTAHAVMQLNAEDGGNRKFIMVQLPEPTDVKSEAHKAGFATIAEISKERIRRAGAKISTDHPHVDTGFRVLKIDSSNMKDVYYQPHALTQADLVEMTSHIKDDRTDEDLLFQVMLDFGVPLSLPIDCRTIDGQNVYFVAGNSLVACFDGLSTTIVDEVAKVTPLRFVSSERAIAYDQDKTNIKERFGQLSAQTDVRFI